MRTLRYGTMVLAAVIGFSQNVAAQHEGGGTLTIAAGAILEDASTGRLHQVQIQAQESLNPGVGSAGLSLFGGGLQVCTVQGGGPLTVGQPVPTPICGTAFSQPVRIDRCTATIEAHSSAHADYPHTAYLGGVTIDISYKRTGSPNSDGELEVTVHTPKGQIHLKGKLTGVVTMPTCNF